MFKSSGCVAIEIATEKYCNGVDWKEWVSKRREGEMKKGRIRVDTPSFTVGAITGLLVGLLLEEGKDRRRDASTPSLPLVTKVAAPTVHAPGVHAKKQAVENTTQVAANDAKYSLLRKFGLPTSKEIVLEKDGFILSWDQR